MPQIGIMYAGKEFTWDEARVVSENPSFPYPPPLIEAMADQRDDQVPSASSVLGCLRQFELKRTTDYFGESGGELPPMFGTAWHDYMEKYRNRILQPGDMTETRLSTKVKVGRKTLDFSGKMDFFRPGVLISDWKSKQYLPQGFTPPSYHVGQVNIYNWLAAENGYEAAPTWELVYVTQSWVLRFQDATRPVAEVGEWVRGRLAAWAAASGTGTLPPPVPELFQSDQKGKALPPCAWCPVREACLQALKSENDRPF